MTKSTDASEPKEATPIVVEPAQEPAEDTRPPMKEISGVRMTSPSVDSKSLTMEDLSNMGAVHPKGDLVFNKANNFFVSVDEINASTVDALLATSDFAIEQ